uniref:Reverse transcriptase domain-containing protein n=3 Tax=Aegilops tauschii subsp. strangulata TaxID=200361 RepID=A0A453K4Y3_AEGTS
MKVIAWNCHGLGNPSAVRSLLELQRAEDPDILFLSETKLREKEIEFLRWRWSLVHMVVQDCDGRCGGLALFWRRGVEVNLRSKGRCHIDAEVVAEDGVKWRLTRIYGESKAGEKENTWRLLRTLHGQTDLPWLCLGDFNEILFVREKEGGPARAQGCMDAFRRALEACELNDLGYVGDPFTWRNNWRDAAGYTRERLDRAVANVGWRCLFPLYKIIKGDPRHSDHRPVIAELNGQTIGGFQGGGQRCFRFEARWLKEEGCEQVVTEAWEAAINEEFCSVGAAVRRIGGSLVRWDREVLGEPRNRIRRAKKDLEKCRRGVIDQHQVSREHLLRYKLSRLEDQYNLYWQQRAHVNWLKNGDRNTGFFHAHASERRRVNTIRSLKRDGGGVVEREEEIGPFISNYYKSLFMSSAGPLNDELLQHVPKTVTHEMNEQLMKPLSGDEITHALNSIGDFKAPGPDGMPAIFYKKFWEKMGAKIQEEVLSVLNGGDMPAGWNETIIVLIPKVKNPDRLTQYRPISLCNVLYKLISKVLANRLKVILPDIISPTQSAFVPGRMITDNVLLAYEITHMMHRKKGGRDGLVAVKLDMSKAYDRVEWDFLEKMMVHMGFSSAWRGLRQGDPLSPYLFILCAEAFSILLQHAELDHTIEGIQICPQAHRINHLFFADDSLIVMKATVASAEKLQQVLALYEAQSGQMINKDKSSAFFSKGMSGPRKQQVLNALHIPSESKKRTLLGAPSSPGGCKK